ncbi:MAG TPA: uroporphyrinogen decarboxylase [Gammaproteobacteria bacterium]|nr:uroporphyrinogen decarboxylase [Gammaproteobacteria bacterium]
MSEPGPRNDRLLRALARQPVDRTPVWMMRQAGRYLPEYREVRERVPDFMTLCRTPELACEVTLQPLRRFDLDAAILFSDILTVPEAMGLGLHFVPGEGPRFERPVRSRADVGTLPRPDPARQLAYVPEAVRTIRRELGGKVPLIGFSGSPWTLATYMVEGRPSRQFAHIKGMLYDDPGTLHRLLALLSDTLIDYLGAQIEAGAEALQIFDTWGGTLSTPAYRAFSLDYMARILNGLERERDGRHVPVILFTKGGGAWLEDIAATGCDAVGLDWSLELGAARARVGDRVALQGNMDPAVLRARPEVIHEEVARVLRSYGAGHGHVFNLGHGITPDVPPEHAAAMVEAVRELSPAWHTEP